MNLYEDQVKRALFVSKAVAVTPSDTVDLAIPGEIFLDQNSTEGNVKVDLMNGGTITITLRKGDIPPFLVRRVYATGTTAVGIFVNPIEQ